MKIFRTDKNENLEEIKGATEKKEFSKEEVIHKLVENNIHVLFPGFQFIKTKPRMLDSNGVQFELDSIVYDESTRALVIIEYKKVRNRDVIAQGLAYLQLLQEQHANLAHLYQQKTNNIIDDIETSFNWEESRVIFISPEYTKYQQKAAFQIPRTIELYEIKNYEKGILTLNRIGVGNAKKNGGLTSEIPRGKHFRSDEYDVEDYLNGKYDGRRDSVPDNIKTLYNNLVSEISKKFDGIEFKQRKLYGGFYSTQDSSPICSFDVKKSKIDLYYSPSKTELIQESDFVNHFPQGHYGNGDFTSIISNEVDIKNALSIIALVHSDKIS